ncbi:D-alanyl-D-alanine carboxypeptidase/D-alanyl-D-alanine-endopeptidase [bacterium]|nr:D-alanyl-D-alanine carboxypeptidase/D-alanyl-D-alanine-endopeptidase [bacterium]
MTILSTSAETITRTLKTYRINPNTISISVRDIKTGSIYYSLNDKMPMTPASTLKLLTSSASFDTLGKYYKFATALYKSTNNDLYLKLGADPFLTSGDIENLFKTAKKKNIREPKHVYVDDNIFDKVEWGEGWQWDDDLNPLMPKFSAYNLDGNLLNINLIPQLETPLIEIKPFYPITVMNTVQTVFKTQNRIKVERNNSIAPNIINISGILSKPDTIKIPVNNPKLYFKLRLEEAIKNTKIEYYNPIGYENLPVKNVYRVDVIYHDINDVMKSILKDSNNLAAETIFKLAGHKWKNEQGNIQNSLDMLNSYIEKLDLSDNDIKVVDGSGVSKNNIMSADFMTKFLMKRINEPDFEIFNDFMASPGEGTLKNRMLYFENVLKAKTGTLSDTSAIAGYIKDRKGKIYAFDIMIKDAKTSNADKKNIEEQILRQIYMN